MSIGEYAGLKHVDLNNLLNLGNLTFDILNLCTPPLYDPINQRTNAGRCERSRRLIPRNRGLIQNIDD